MSEEPSGAESLEGMVWQANARLTVTIERLEARVRELETALTQTRAERDKAQIQSLVYEGAIKMVYGGVKQVLGINIYED